MDIQSVISGSIQTFLKANDLYGKNKSNTVIMKLNNVIYDNSTSNIIVVNMSSLKRTYITYICLIINILKYRYFQNRYYGKSSISFIHLWCKNYMKLADNSKITFSFWNQDVYILDINQINYNSSNYISFFVNTE